jgi:hypothetical protein
MSADDQITPFLIMMQGLSPGINPSEAKHIEGAGLGMIVNTGTKEFYKGTEGLDIIICASDRNYKAWVPRDLGGGFRGSFDETDPVVREVMGRMIAKYRDSAPYKMPRYRDGKWSDEPARTPDTDEPIELIDTAQYYVLAGPHGDLNPQTVFRAIVAFKSTALSVWRGANSRWSSWKFSQKGMMKPAPRWAFMWHLTTRPESKGPGKNYYNWNLEPVVKNYKEAPLTRIESAIPLSYEDRRALYDMGSEFRELYARGAVKVDYEASAGAAAEDADNPPF